MSTATIHRWHDGALELLDYCDMAETTIEAADSWFVTDGRTLALGLHRERFLSAVDGRVDAEAFWEAAVALIPREGDWFPRVELQLSRGSLLLVFRLRSAPERTESVVLTTHRGPDPRTVPAIKGPDLERMTHLRTEAQAQGAGELVILSPDGFVIDGGYSALVWWRGAILCAPPLDFERVDSVTARSLLGLAEAVGIETWREAVTPAELDGTEIWSLNALHGPRIVTKWIEGPGVAELPGRLRLWRDRLAVLRRPIS